MANVMFWQAKEKRQEEMWEKIMTDAPFSAFGVVYEQEFGVPW